MRAISIREPGGVDVLELTDAAVPEPGTQEVLVRIRVAGINRADILQRMGAYPAPQGAPDDIPGLEFAGEIAKIGSDVEEWAPGDRVMGILGGGGYAELAVVPVGQLLPVPSGLSWIEAGAIPEVFLTAADALFSCGRMEPGDRVLVHTAGGGVGTAALQLARVAGAKSVIGTASAGKLEQIRKTGLPLDLGIDRGSDSFADEVNGYTDGAGVNVILDTVGGSYWEDNLTSLSTLGRLVVVGLLGGSNVKANLRKLMAKRATIVGTVLRARSTVEKAQVTEDFQKRFLSAFVKGGQNQPPALIPIIDRTYPLAEASEAHRRMESNNSFGKVLLEID
tara:strand:+ start:2112 stop:3119 length:1008 start_codon:yes stop_codon:yes gene_type:complete